MKKNHSPKAINPKNKFKSGARVDPLSTYTLPKIPHGYFNEEGKTMALGMGIHKYDSRKAVEEETADTEDNCLTPEGSGKGE